MLRIAKSRSEFPGPRPDVHGPPSPAGFGIYGVLGSAGSYAAHRKSARWSISLHYRIASLQGRIGVEPAVPGGEPGRRRYGAVCGHVRTGPARAITRQTA
jgi:hypothetical protein